MESEQGKRKLNEQQQAAVNTDSEETLVLAGAGSGKTFTIIERVLHLMNQGADPKSILLLTFTHAAALEMKKRLKKEISSSLPYVGTFHSFCATILRSFGKSSGYGPDYSIYDATDCRDVMDAVIRDNYLDISLKKVMPYIELDKVIPPESDIKQAVNEFRKMLKKYKAIDFQGLLKEALYILKNPTLQNRIAGSIRFILVDEYQDTNPRQERILELMNPKNLYVVGDPGQAIYGWRGAKRDFILSFPERHEGAVEYRLEANYRSIPIIVDLANAIIKKGRDKPLQLFSKVEDSAASEGVLEYIPLPSKDDEGFLIADKLQEWLQMLQKAGASQEEIDEAWGDIAILSRTNEPLEGIGAILKMQGIPYVICSGKSLWDEEPSRLIIAAIALMHNPYDDIRTINLMRFYGLETIDRRTLMLEANEREIPLLYVWAEDVNGIRGDVARMIMEQYKGLQRMNTSSLASILAEAFIRECEPHLIYQGSGRPTKAAEIFITLDHIRAWEEKNDHGHAKMFLQWFGLRDIQDRVERGKRVNLLTIHGAKGLEWGSVFLTGLVDGLLPHRLSFSEEQIDEELRLFYVGVTRAKRRLIITSYASMISYGGKFKITDPSRFLAGLKFG